MGRFTQIVNHLRGERLLLLSKGKKRRAKASHRKSKKITFDNPDLERIFNAFPKDVQEMLKKV